MINDEYKIKEESFKKLKRGSFLNIVSLFLGIAFGIALSFVIISLVFSAISSHLPPGSVESYILKRFYSDIYLIAPFIVVYIVLLSISVYSIYLYSKTVSLLSTFNNTLKGPAKFTKYLYIIVIATYIAIIFEMLINFIIIKNTPLFIIYMVLATVEFLLILYLLIGIYRIGVIYDNRSLRLGAIFYLIPFLDMASPFLLYSGSKKLLEKNEIKS